MTESTDPALPELTAESASAVESVRSGVSLAPPAQQSVPVRLEGDPRSGYALLFAEARPVTEGERELAAVVAITRALAGLPEASRRKVLSTVEDFVQLPPRRRTAAQAAEGA